MYFKLRFFCLHTQHCLLYALLCFSVEGEPHEKAVELLKAARSSVKLVVRWVKE